MRKVLIIAILFFVMPEINAQNYIGSWSGKLKIENQELHITFHISKKGDDYLTSLEVPAQGLKGLQATSTQIQGSKISIHIQPIMAWFAGELKNDSLKGNFSQSGMTFPLNLSRGKIAIRRPQTPKPPFNYTQEEVTIETETPNTTLSGTLTLPKGTGKFPAVILLTGSGAQNRDEEIMGHKTFAVLADHLTRNGIAVLRYDDRGVGKSTGRYAGATTSDFADDALAAFSFLRKRTDINPSCIGMIGHSEGGTAAFMAAAKNKNIAYIVSLAGMGIRGDSLLLSQNKDLLSPLFPADTVTVYYRAMENIFSALQSAPKTRETLMNTIREKYKSLLPDKLYKNICAITQIYDPWMVFFSTLDPAKYLAQVQCPVMAVNGNKDTQVKAEVNLKAIKKGLSSLPEQNIVIKQYPNLNHLLQTCVTGEINEYFTIDETISPTVLSDITSWIKKICK